MQQYNVKKSVQFLVLGFEPMTTLLTNFKI